MNGEALRYLRYLADHARPGVYARKTEKGYAPVRAIISNLVLERHLSGQQPVGAYLVNNDKVEFAALDVDDHEAAVGWDSVAAATLRLRDSAAKIGLMAHPWRSGGGAGSHLFFVFDQPQNARDVRFQLRALLAENGFAEGTGGLAKNEVEIFPKQDRVGADGLGNLIALPGARASLPLDANISPYALELLDANLLSCRVSNPVQPSPCDPVHRLNSPPMDGDDEACRDALRNVPSDDYAAWIRVGLALKRSFGEKGFSIWEEWSQKSEKYAGEDELLRRWGGLKPNGDVGLGSVLHLGREYGWNGATEDWVRDTNGRFGILTYGRTTAIICKNGDRHPDYGFMPLSKATFIDRLTPEKVALTSPEGTIKRVSKARAWLEHPLASHYHRLDFNPSMPPGHNGRTWNIWTGFAVEPAKGDWSLLHDHVVENIADGDVEKAGWAFNWMALGVQKPAEPIGTAMVMIGAPGTGKGVLANAYGALWGEHFIAVTHAEHVSGRFTGHFAGKAFVHIDEGTFGGNRREAGNLKTRVTEPWIVLEQKGVDAIRMRNRMKFMISSNEASVVPADRGDRRFTVFDVGVDHREDHSYFGAIQAQLEEGGLEAMLYDLLRRDISVGPNPRQTIRNQALAEQILLAQGPDIRYVHNLLESGRLPQNDVAGPSATTIKAMIRDMRSQHPDSGYINDARLGRLLNQIFDGIITRQNGEYIASQGDGLFRMERSTRYEFPPLERARRLFETFFRTPIEWGIVEEWQRDPEECI